MHLPYNICYIWLWLEFNSSEFLLLSKSLQLYPFLWNIFWELKIFLGPMVLWSDTFSTPGDIKFRKIIWEPAVVPRFLHTFALWLSAFLLSQNIGSPYVHSRTQSVYIKIIYTDCVRECTYGLPMVKRKLHECKLWKVWHLPVVEAFWVSWHWKSISVVGKIAKRTKFHYSAQWLVFWNP
jgi:hypothetical protein